MSVSDELKDEIQVLNSIYGESCLVASEEDGAIFILELPGDEASSLKLRFPSSYPQNCPEVLGVHHSSGGKKGAGARDLQLFRQSLDEVFQVGAVCLFDAAEDFIQKLDNYEESREEEDLDNTNGKDQVSADRESVQREEEEEDDSHMVDITSLPSPPWTVSDMVTDSKSTFIARVSCVSSPEQARLYLQQLLASDKKVRNATHNITAWRIRGSSGTVFQDCDDDGEDAAGGRLLHLMQLMDLWDAMVVVTRWYGGVKLGPRRFAIINTVARDGFVKAGMVPEAKDRKKGKGSSK